jgi:hypothetical protein
MVEQYHVPAVERAIERHTHPSQPGVHILFAVTGDGFGLYYEAFTDEYEAEAALVKELMRESEWSEGVVDFTVETFYRG